MFCLLSYCHVYVYIYVCVCVLMFDYICISCRTVAGFRVHKTDTETRGHADTLGLGTKPSWV